MKLFAVFFFHFCASQDPLSGYVEVQEGAPSVMLPCDYKEQLLDVVTVKWSRSDLNPTTVHKRREEDDIQEQNQQFKGRTSMRPDALDSLDFNLTLTKPQPSDSGVYICSMIDKTEVTLSEVQLYVREIFPTWSKVLLVLLVLLVSGLLFYFRHYFISVYRVEVDSGEESVLLPFKTALCLPDDVTVTWSNSEEMKIYTSSRRSWIWSTDQHWYYKGRTEMKKKLKPGDFSLTLKNPTVRDSDIYTCTVCDASGKLLTRKQVQLEVKAGADSFIIAIDFGYGYSGYAFNVKPRQEGGEAQLKRWDEGLGLDRPKTPTCILLDEDGKFLKFGSEAKTAYNKMRGEETEKHYFYEDIKDYLGNPGQWSNRRPAANKKEKMTRLEVVREVLRFLKDDALKTIKVHPEGGEFRASDFTWVLTFPPNWGDRSKELLMEAAVQAGLVTEETKGRLMLVPEAEAALAWCLKPPSDGSIQQNHSRDSADRPPGPTDAATSCTDPPGGQVAVHFGSEPEETTVLLETRPRGGGRYLVVDCGESSDFAVYEVLEGGALKKLNQDDELYLGGEDVDDEFKEFLSEIFSDKLWKEYEANFPNEVQEMMDDFLRVKHVDEDVQICCPENLREQAEKEKNIERFFDSVGGASWDDGRIRISRDTLRSFYKETLQEITNMIRKILDRYSTIGSIVLVGGLAESQILRQNITHQFGSIYKVLCPLRPLEAVLKGAVELGRNPKLVLPQRKGPACFRCFS